MFPVNVVEHVGGIENVTIPSMRDYLRDHHLGFDPKEPEVEAAYDVVRAYQATGALPTKADLLDTMFDVALTKVAPILGNWQWSVERCRRPLLGTCDRLPAIWHRVSPTETHRGSGLTNAEEVWLPLDVATLLVLRPRGSEQVVDVEPERFRFVNAHLARHCYHFVFHRPGTKDRSREFQMAAHRPSVRFWHGPLLDSSGAVMPGRDVIHQWVPIRDDQ
jgi:hypothetical protein